MQMVLLCALLTAVPSSPDVECGSDARKCFNSARTSFAKGNFSDAAARFEKAYVLKPRPEILFNAAVAYEKGRNVSDALDAYQRYLTSFPQATDAATVRKNMDRLSEDLSRQLALAGPVPSQSFSTVSTRTFTAIPVDVSVPTPSDAYGLAVTQNVSRPSAVRQVAPWLLAGSGAAFATAAILGVTAQGARKELMGAVHSGEEAQRLFETAQGRSGGANIAFGAAGALLVAGGVCFAVDAFFKPQLQESAR